MNTYFFASVYKVLFTFLRKIIIHLNIVKKVPKKKSRNKIMALNISKLKKKSIVRHCEGKTDEMSD